MNNESDRLIRAWTSSVALGRGAAPHAWMVLAAVLLIGGCAQPGRGTPAVASERQANDTAQRAEPARRQTPSNPDPLAVDTAATDAPVSEVADLAAIQRFLARTETYGRPAESGGSEVQQTDIRTTEYNPQPQRLTDPIGDAAGARSGADPEVVIRTPVADTENDVSTAVHFEAPGGPALPVIRSVGVSLPQTVADGIADRGHDDLQPNTPMDLPKRHQADSIDSLIARLEEELEATGDPELQWRLAMLKLGASRGEDSRDLSQRLTGEERELIKATIDAAEAARLAVVSPTALDADVVDRAARLSQTLAAQADPQVATMAFCRRVHGFGLYDEMDADRFVAGRPIETIVYCEVRRLQAQRAGDGRFRSELASRLEVLTADGQSVWTHDESQIEDVCRAQRQDFFLVQRIELPPTLPAGAYVLKITVEDRLSGRFNQGTLPFSLKEAIQSQLP